MKKYITLCVLACLAQGHAAIGKTALAAKVAEEAGQKALIQQLVTAESARMVAEKQREKELEQWTTEMKNALDEEKIEREMLQVKHNEELEKLKEWVGQFQSEVRNQLDQFQNDMQRQMEQQYEMQRQVKQLQDEARIQLTHDNTYQGNDLHAHPQNDLINLSFDNKSYDQQPHGQPYSANDFDIFDY